MDTDQAIKLIQKTLPTDRVEHSIRVAEVASELASYYNINTKKIKLAALLHDYAKNLPTDELKRWILASNLSKDLLFYHPAIWHGPVGSIMINQKYGIEDRNILQAIQNHTTGSPNMIMFEQIIFVADYIEPARSFPGLAEIRELAYDDLDKTTLLILKNMINFLMLKKQTIYPSTFHAYNKFSLSYINNNYNDGGMGI